MQIAPAIPQGAAHPAPYDASELSAAFTGHRRLVATLLKRMADELLSMADGHDASVRENIDIVTHEYNEELSGKAVEGAWLDTEHAALEQHHWDVRWPDRPTLALLAEYLADRAARATAMTGSLPGYVELPEGALSECVRNTEDDIATMLGVER